MSASWVPDCGDIVWLERDQQSGRKQAAHCPAVVLSPASYNKKSGMIVCCPTTTKIKGYPFELPLAGEATSVVLSDQVRSLDWRAHRAKHKGRVSEKKLEAVRERARLLVG
ncbi:endoribonuclease MazF [Gluconobacter frateurii]|uniref:endoribonuclease MazF n=1 Tax=Gluconobacter frateurii TaxID=38308 RepID=UPI000C08D317|nr:endoribonuclease MazF [Gluconobacter frateurii]GLP91996.1 endoribonuclease MazF [Gluconobacter frateurii]